MRCILEQYPIRQKWNMVMNESLTSGEAVWSHIGTRCMRETQYENRKHQLSGTETTPPAGPFEQCSDAVTSITRAAQTRIVLFTWRSIYPPLASQRAPYLTVVQWTAVKTAHVSLSVASVSEEVFQLCEVFGRVQMSQIHSQSTVVLPVRATLSHNWPQWPLYPFHFYQWFCPQCTAIKSQSPTETPESLQDLAFCFLNPAVRDTPECKGQVHGPCMLSDRNSSAGGGFFLFLGVFLAMWGYLLVYSH